MLTFFTIPKPFRGHLAVIQQNAIKSWTLLRPTCEVMLCGDDAGVAEAAHETRLRHLPAIARNEYGTPLVSDVFAQVERVATHTVLCYINADIIVMADLLAAVARVLRPRFLMLGQRWDLDVTAPLSFADPSWEANLRSDVRSRGVLHPYVGVDYYVFPKGLWGALPPFAVGRPSYDNWLIWKARSQGVPVIDATRVVLSVHQNHERTYSSLGRTSPDGGDEYQLGLEARRNLELAGGRRHRYTLRNANWVLTRRWLLPALTPWRLWGRLKSRVKLLLLR